LSNLLHFFIRIVFGLIVISTCVSCVALKKTESSFIGSYFGKVKTVTTIEFDGNDTTTLTIENFNTRGKPLRFEFYYGGYTAPKNVNEFTYDQKGCKTQSIKINDSGDTTITNHNSSSYDNVTVLTNKDKKLDPDIPDGAKTRIIGGIISGKIKRKSILYLDKHGDSLESHEFDTSGRIKEKTVYITDSRGNQLSRTRYKQDTVIYSITQSFDQYSNVITSQRIDGTVPRKKTVFRYDFDKYHNWIHRYLVQEKKERLVEKQVIEYY